MINVFKQLLWNITKQLNLEHQSSHVYCSLIDLAFLWELRAQNWEFRTENLEWCLIYVDHVGVKSLVNSAIKMIYKTAI